MNLRKIFPIILIFWLPFLSYTQSSERSRFPKKGSDIFIEFAFNSGFKTENALSSLYKFKAIPTIFLGYKKNRHSIQLGIEHYKISDYKESLRCAFYPCPNASDSKIVGLNLDWKYLLRNNSKLSYESVFNIRSAITYYQLDYYYHNKEGENWVSEWTPYLSRMQLNSGLNIKHYLGEKVSIFITPMVSLNLILSPFIPELFTRDIISLRTGISYKLRRKNTNTNNG